MFLVWQIQLAFLSEISYLDPCKAWNRKHLLQFEHEDILIFFSKTTPRNGKPQELVFLEILTQSDRKIDLLNVYLFMVVMVI